MSRTLLLVSTSICLISGAALVLASSCCSSASAQGYAKQLKQSGSKSSYSASYAANSKYNGNSYAQDRKGNGSSYASSGGTAGGTSYAQSFQAQSSSYASSAGNGSSYLNRGSSYAGSSKQTPYSQQLKLNKSSLLGIMRGAPASKTPSYYSSSISNNLSRAGTASHKAVPTASTAKSTAAPAAGPKWSEFNKRH